MGMQGENDVLACLAGLPEKDARAPSQKCKKWKMKNECSNKYKNNTHLALSMWRLTLSKEAGSMSLRKDATYEPTIARARSVGGLRYFVFPALPLNAPMYACTRAVDILHPPPSRKVAVDSPELTM